MAPAHDLSAVDVPGGQVAQRGGRGGALAGGPAVIGRISAGQFPREMALAPGGQRLLVSSYLSLQLEAGSVPSIP
jgi:hypothetical protein